MNKESDFTRSRLTREVGRYASPTFYSFWQSKISPTTRLGRFSLSPTNGPIKSMRMQKAWPNARCLLGLGAPSQLKPAPWKFASPEKKGRRIQRCWNETDLTTVSVASKPESQPQISLAAGLARFLFSNSPSSPTYFFQFDYPLRDCFISLFGVKST